MLIAVSLMFCNVLNSEILESPAVTLKQVLVAVTNSANRTNCVRKKNFTTRENGEQRWR